MVIHKQTQFIWCRKKDRYICDLVIHYSNKNRNKIIGKKSNKMSAYYKIQLNDWKILFFNLSNIGQIYGRHFFQDVQIDFASFEDLQIENECL